MNSIFTKDLRSLFPEKMCICNDAGDWELSLGDLEKTFPRIQAVYHHSTPEKSGDVLSDGEPDYLGFDIHFLEEGKRLNLNIDITYGDAMMFSFKTIPGNNVEVGHYNGYGSKFDSESKFHFKEGSIQDLINLFNSFNPMLGLSRDKFTFLDGDRNSFKMEKVRWVSDFKTFNLLNRP
jgi:hypothetical protein